MNIIILIILLIILNMFDPSLSGSSKHTISPHRGMIVYSLFFERQKNTSTQMFKFYALKSKSVSILQPKKPEQTILSPIILAMPNVSYGKDNPTLTACLSSFGKRKGNDLCLLQSTMIYVYVNSTL